MEKAEEKCSSDAVPLAPRAVVPPFKQETVPMQPQEDTENTSERPLARAVLPQQVVGVSIHCIHVCPSHSSFVSDGGI